MKFLRTSRSSAYANTLSCPVNFCQIIYWKECLFGGLLYFEGSDDFTFSDELGWGTILWRFVPLPKGISPFFLRRISKSTESKAALKSKKSKIMERLCCLLFRRLSSVFTWIKVSFLLTKPNWALLILLIILSPILDRIAFSINFCKSPIIAIRPISSRVGRSYSFILLMQTSLAWKCKLLGVFSFSFSFSGSYPIILPVSLLISSRGILLPYKGFLRITGNGFA